MIAAPGAGAILAASQLSAPGATSWTAWSAPIEVMPAAQQSSLGAVTLSYPVYIGGGCIWIQGAYPGATVTISSGGVVVGSALATDGTAEVGLSSPIAGDVLVATQHYGGISGTPTALYPSPLEAPKGFSGPLINAPLYACSSSISLSGIVSGALVTCTLGADETSTLTCCPAPSGSLWLPRALLTGEEVTVSQVLPGLPGEPSGVDPRGRSFVLELSPVPQPNVYEPICAGMATITVTDLVVGAEVNFYLYHDDFDSLGTALAPLNPLTFTAWGTTCTFTNIGPLIADYVLKVTQTACGVESAGPIVVIGLAVDTGGAALIVPPVYSCATRIHVTNLVVGNNVVVEGTFPGHIGTFPLSEPVLVSSAEMDISMTSAVSANETLFVRSAGCVTGANSLQGLLVESYTTTPGTQFGLPVPTWKRPVPC